MREKYWVDEVLAHPETPTPPVSIAESAGVPIDEILRQTPVFDDILKEETETDAQPI